MQQSLPAFFTNKRMKTLMLRVTENSSDRSFSTRRHFRLEIPAMDSTDCDSGASDGVNKARSRCKQLFTLRSPCSSRQRGRECLIESDFAVRSARFKAKSPAVTYVDQNSVTIFTYSKESVHLCCSVKFTGCSLCLISCSETEM